MQNDTVGFFGAIDFINCIALKLNLESPVVKQTVIFLKHLLSLSNESGQPVIIFAHSQGAIIVEHALRYLEKKEQSKLRVFTFGGGSMISLETCHPDSCNYANAKDLICLIGSPNWQKLALEHYNGKNKGKSDNEIIKELAMRDLFLSSDFLSPFDLENQLKVHIDSYEMAFAQIRNLRVLDPGNDTDAHGFKNDCYQNVVKAIIKKYQEERQQ